MNDKKIRILIAEDDFFVRKEIKRTLSQSNYQVLGEATDGKQAIELTCSLQPDVVLMDIKMPVMNGIDSTRLIQEKCPTPVVFLTAHESKEMLDQASNAGASSYITKPPNKNAINQAVTVAMARHNDMMELRRVNYKLEQALNEIKTLRGILPLCSFCKKIRDDKGYWEQVDVYIQEHTEADISHGICPECMEEHYPELDIED